MHSRQVFTPLVATLVWLASSLAPAATVTLSVSANSDDADQTTGGTMYVTDGFSYLSNYCGFRFQNVTIPAGATIVSATIDLYAYGSGTASFSVDLAAEDGDNPSTFTTSSNNISNRTRTTAQTNWTINSGSFIDGVAFTSPDFSSSIQEVVNRSGWSSGNALVVITSPVSGNKGIWKYSGNTSYAPVLRVEYSSDPVVARMLFIINGGSPSTQEQLRISQFEDWGYFVTTIQDNSSQSEYDTSLAGIDVVYVSEEILSDDVSYKLRETTVGVVNEERCLADEFGFSTQCASALSNHTALTVTNDAHYITSVYGTGAATVFDSSEPVTYLSGTQASGLTLLGDWSSSNGFAAIDTGAALATTYNGSSVALGRRVFLGFDGSFDFDELNANGLIYVQRAIEWASGAGDTSHGLVAHWKLDETSGTTAVDSSGSGNNGTLTGNPNWTTAGIHAGALDFETSDGDDRIDCGTFSVPGSSISLSAWINQEEPLNDARILIRSIGNSGSQQSWGLTVDQNGELDFRINAGGVFDRLQAPGVISPGNWNHVVGTYDGVTMRLYLDSKLIASKTHSAGGALTDNPSHTVTIGDSVAGSRPYDGLIDDVRVYYRVLSNEEISQLNGNLGCWTFDEGTGTTIADGSGNANDASFNTGTPTWVDGVRGYALEFDGSQDAITDRDFDPPATGAVAFWIRRSTAFSSRERPFGVGGDWEARQDGDGSLKFDIGVSPYTGDEPFSTTGTIPLQDEWSHVVAQFDDVANTYEVWVDGQLDASGVSPRDLVEQSDGRLSFGARTGSSERFQGALDEFCVFNRWLTSAEIAELYGLVIHWKLDETSGFVPADSSGSNFDGSLTDGQWTAGNLDGAIEFDGSGDRIELSHQAALQPDEGAVAFWFRPDDVSSNQGLFSKDYSGYQNGGHLTIRLRSNGTIRVRLQSTSTSYEIDGTAVTAGAWNHLVFVWGSDGMILYQDGVVTATDTYTGGMGTSSGGTGNDETIYLGANGWGTSPTEHFDGAMDDFRFYNRIVSPSEVNDLFGGSTGAGVRITSWVEVANP